MSSLTFFLLRLLPLLFVTTAVAVATGYLRSQYGFLLGIQGMALGGLVGWVFGRAFRRERGATWSVWRRFLLALSGAAVFGVVQALTVSAAHSLPAGNGVLWWMEKVVDGYRAEPFASYSRYRWDAVSGALEGPWWVFMVLLDMGLYAFLHLAFFTLGWLPDGPVAEEPGED